MRTGRVCHRTSWRCYWRIFAVFGVVVARVRSEIENVAERSHSVGLERFLKLLSKIRVVNQNFPTAIAEASRGWIASRGVVFRTDQNLVVVDDRVFCVVIAEAAFA